jgi:hypothetical protein
MAPYPDLSGGCTKSCLFSTVTSNRGKNALLKGRRDLNLIPPSPLSFSKPIDDHALLDAVAWALREPDHPTPSDFCVTD